MNETVNIYKSIAATPVGRKLITVRAVNFRVATERTTSKLNAHYGKDKWTYEVEPLKTGTARISS